LSYKIQGWKFIFFGANINLGISADRAQNYNVAIAGIIINYNGMSYTMSSFRENSEMDLD